MIYLMPLMKPQNQITRITYIIQITVQTIEHFEAKNKMS